MAPTPVPSPVDALSLTTKLVLEGAPNTAQEAVAQLHVSEQPPTVYMAQAPVQAQPPAPVTGPAPGQPPPLVPARGPVAAAPVPAPLNVQSRKRVFMQQQFVSAGVSVPVLAPAPGPVIALALPPGVHPLPGFGERVNGSELNLTVATVFPLTVLSMMYASSNVVALSCTCFSLQ